MKMRIASCLYIAVTVSSLSLVFSPTLFSQTPSNPPSNLSSSSGSSQNTKTTDSTADRNSSSTGDSDKQPGTIERTNSKDTTNSLDKNPSTTSTDSDEKASSKNHEETSDKASGKISDKAFLLKAAQSGMTEVQLGQVAQEKGSSSEVKQFGARMVTDHSKANDELKSIASQKGVTVPSALDSTHQAMVEHLKGLSGDAFDRAYVKHMVKDHQKDVAEFQEESTSGQDADIKAFAGKTLEVVKSHLTEIESIQSKMQK